jgi:hypothetical protein
MNYCPNCRCISCQQERAWQTLYKDNAYSYYYYDDPLDYPEDEDYSVDFWDDYPDYYEDYLADPQELEAQEQDAAEATAMFVSRSKAFRHSTRKKDRHTKMFPQRPKAQRSATKQLAREKSFWDAFNEGVQFRTYIQRNVEKQA